MTFSVVGRAKTTTLSVLVSIWLFGCDEVDDSVTGGGASVAGIVNGTPTEYDDWQAAVMIQASNVLCSGTLIHPEVVLTAGHCVYLDTSQMNYDFRNRPRSVKIYGGSNGETLLAVAETVSVHPSWEGDINDEAGDLAMIHLDRAISTITPSPLVDLPGPEAGDTGIIVGYGTDPMDSDTLRPLHREGRTTILELKDFYYQIGGETNTCSGDSGGPLFIEQGGVWVLAGVTSFGAATCDAASEGYSVKLLSFCGWLNDTMVDFVGEDLGLEHCKGCDAVTVDAWGAPCGPGHPCCPSGTVCRTPDDFSNDGLGYCAPSCCAIGAADAAYCSNVASGDESCLFSEDDGTGYCGIACGDDNECPEGTRCKNRPFASERICIATAVGDGPQCDPTAPDTAPVDGDGGAAESGGGQSGAVQKGGCSQAVPGRRSDRLRLVRTLLMIPF